MRKGAFIAINLLFIILSVSQVFCQTIKSKIGIGGSVGISNYKGDLDDNFTLIFTRHGAGLHALYLCNNWLSIRPTIYNGLLTANDADGNTASNKSRNLSFRSFITEGGLNIILWPFGMEERNILGKISPYLFSGICVFKFNPQIKYNGKWIDLQPLGTEGQYLEGDQYPEPYKLTQFSVPLGAGIAYKLSSNFLLGIEYGFRKTFTDYLDDVSSFYPDMQNLRETNELAYILSDRSSQNIDGQSGASGAQRGNNKYKDWYMYTNINLSYFIDINEKPISNKKTGNKKCIGWKHSD